MKKYLAEIEGTMKVVTKTGRVARQPLPPKEISPGVCSMVLIEGAVTHLEVQLVNRIGSPGPLRYWVGVSDLYEVTG